MKASEFRVLCRSLVAGAVVSSAFIACSSDSGSHPSMVDDPGGGSNAAAGSAGHAGSHVAEAGAAGNDAIGVGGDSVGGDGVGGDAGSPPLGTAGAPPVVGPAACSETAKWATPSTLDGVSSAAEETLLSVTLDELDLAFSRAGVLYVAHRASSSAAFGALTPVVLPVGWSASQGAGLSADGKRLVLVSSPDQKKLGELTRSTREQPFSGDVDESAFAAINQDAVYTGKVYASPVVSGGDDQLIYNSAFADSSSPTIVYLSSTVVYSTRTGSGAWSAPRQLQVKVLDGAAAARRLPTGLSADQRTLFYFNEETMQQEARWRTANSASSPLYDVVSLGMRRGATPNTACDRLYSGANGDVVVEKD